MCLEPSSNKLYTSRYVEFVENVFPFATSSGTSSPPTLNLAITEPLSLPPSAMCAPPTSSSQPPQRHPSPPSLLPTRPSQNSVVTRSINNIFKPNLRYGLIVAFNDVVEPTSVFQALSDPRWREAMSAEFNILLTNGTWYLLILLCCRL